MSLQKNIVLNNGLEITNAYLRISKITIEHNADELTGIGDTQIIEIRAYLNKNAFDTKKDNIEVYNIIRTYDDTMSASFADIYTYLKTLPEFAGAVDV